MSTSKMPVAVSCISDSVLRMIVFRTSHGRWECHPLAHGGGAMTNISHGVLGRIHIVAGEQAIFEARESSISNLKLESIDEMI